MSQAEQTSQEVKGTTAETAVTAQLRDKIKSKMDVAKFFAGFISLLIGILLVPAVGCFGVGFVLLLAQALRP